MLFDTDSVIILKRKLTCQIECYSLDLPCFLLSPIWLSGTVLLFPNFQRTFPIALRRGITVFYRNYHCPFFLTECKGKGLWVTVKINSELFPVFWRDFQKVLWRTCPLFMRGCKNTLLLLTSKVFGCFLFTSASHSFHLFEELLRFFLNGRRRYAGDKFLPIIFIRKMLRLNEMQAG